MFWLPDFWCKNSYIFSSSLTSLEQSFRATWDALPRLRSSAYPLNKTWSLKFRLCDPRKGRKHTSDGLYFHGKFGGTTNYWLWKKSRWMVKSWNIVQWLERWWEDHVASHQSSSLWHALGPSGEYLTLTVKICIIPIACVWALRLHAEHL